MHSTAAPCWIAGLPLLFCFAGCGERPPAFAPNDARHYDAQAHAEEVAFLVEPRFGANLNRLLLDVSMKPGDLATRWSLRWREFRRNAPAEVTPALDQAIGLAELVRGDGASALASLAKIPARPLTPLHEGIALVLSGETEDGGAAIARVLNTPGDRRTLQTELKRAADCTLRLGNPDFAFRLYSAAWPLLSPGARIAVAEDAGDVGLTTGELTSWLEEREAAWKDLADPNLLAAEAIAWSRLRSRVLPQRQAEAWKQAAAAVPGVKDPEVLAERMAFLATDQPEGAFSREFAADWETLDKTPALPLPLRLGSPLLYLKDQPGADERIARSFSLAPDEWPGDGLALLKWRSKIPRPEIEGRLTAWVETHPEDLPASYLLASALESRSSIPAAVEVYRDLLARAARSGSGISWSPSGFFPDLPAGLVAFPVTHIPFDSYRRTRDWRSSARKLSNRSIPHTWPERPVDRLDFLMIALLRWKALEPGEPFPQKATKVLKEHIADPLLRAQLADIADLPLLAWESVRESLAANYGRTPADDLTLLLLLDSLVARAELEAEHPAIIHLAADLAARNGHSCEFGPFNHLSRIVRAGQGLEVTNHRVATALKRIQECVERTLASSSVPDVAALKQFAAAIKDERLQTKSRERLAQLGALRGSPGVMDTTDTNQFLDWLASSPQSPVSRVSQLANGSLATLLGSPQPTASRQAPPPNPASGFPSRPGPGPGSAPHDRGPYLFRHEAAKHYLPPSIPVELSVAPTTVDLPSHTLLMAGLAQALQASGFPQATGGNQLVPEELARRLETLATRFDDDELRLAAAAAFARPDLGQFRKSITLLDSVAAPWSQSAPALLLRLHAAKELNDNPAFQSAQATYRDRTTSSASVPDSPSDPPPQQPLPAPAPEIPLDERLHTMDQRSPEAIRLARQTLSDAAPDDPSRFKFDRARYLAMGILHANGILGEYRDDLEASLAANPEDAPTRARLAELLLHRDVQEPNRALEHLDWLKRRQPSDSPPWIPIRIAEIHLDAVETETDKSTARSARAAALDAYCTALKRNPWPTLDNVWLARMTVDLSREERLHAYRECSLALSAGWSRSSDESGGSVDALARFCSQLIADGWPEGALNQWYQGIRRSALPPEDLARRHRMLLDEIGSQSPSLAATEAARLLLGGAAPSERKWEWREGSGDLFRPVHGFTCEAEGFLEKLDAPAAREALARLAQDAWKRAPEDHRAFDLLLLLALRGDHPAEPALLDHYAATYASRSAQPGRQPVPLARVAPRRSGDGFSVDHFLKALDAMEGAQATITPDFLEDRSQIARTRVSVLLREGRLPEAKEALGRLQTVIRRDAEGGPRFAGHPTSPWPLFRESLVAKSPETAQAILEWLSDPNLPYAGVDLPAPWEMAIKGAILAHHFGFPDLEAAALDRAEGLRTSLGLPGSDSVVATLASAIILHIRRGEPDQAKRLLESLPDQTDADKGLSILDDWRCHFGLSPRNESSSAWQPSVWTSFPNETGEATLHWDFYRATDPVSGENALFSPFRHGKTPVFDVSIHGGTRRKPDLRRIWKADGVRHHGSAPVQLGPENQTFLIHATDTASGLVRSQTSPALPRVIPSSRPLGLSDFTFPDAAAVEFAETVLPEAGGVSFTVLGHESGRPVEIHFPPQPCPRSLTWMMSGWFRSTGGTITVTPGARFLDADGRVLGEKTTYGFDVNGDPHWLRLVTVLGTPDDEFERVLSWPSGTASIIPYFLCTGGHDGEVPLDCFNLRLDQVHTALPSLSAGPREKLHAPRLLFPWKTKRLILGPAERWLVAVDEAGRLVALDLRAPGRVRSLDLPTLAPDNLVSLNEAGDEVLIGTPTSGRLLRWKVGEAAPDGTLEELVVEQPVQSLTTSTRDGTVYVLTSDGDLHVFAPGGTLPRKTIRLTAVPPGRPSGPLLRLSADEKWIQVGTGLPVLISLETGLRADPELQASLHPFPLQSLGQEVPPSHASPRAPGAVSWSRHRGRLTFLGPIDDEPLAHLPHSADLETIVIAPATGYLIGVDNTGNVFRERIEMDLLGARN